MSFLFPAALVLGALSVPLIALYMLKLRRQRVKVSSLLPWSEMQRSEQRSAPFARLKRNLFLLLQLLLLALLVLALARPAWLRDDAQQRALVVVLDTTASMGAADGSPTRFADAVSAADAAIEALGPADEVMVITSGARTEVVVPFTRDLAAARRKLASVELTHASGTLMQGLELGVSLGRSKPGVEVVVFSDGGSEPLQAALTAKVPVRYHRVGNASINTGIVALEVRTDPSNGVDRQVFATVQHFGPVPVDATVEVLGPASVIAVRTERLEPAVATPLVFDLPSGTRGEVSVSVRAAGDSLEIDNRATLPIDDRRSRKVTLVGGDSLTARVLGSDPTIQLRRMAAAEATATSLAGADAILFGAPVPDGIESMNYGVLGPFPGGPVSFGAAQNAPEVLGWRRGHSMLRFTRWDDLTFSSSHTITDRGGLTALVDSDVGPLVLAGERMGGRVVQLGFEPLKSDLPLRVTWPVFLLNTVAWLTQGEGQRLGPSSIPTGSTWLARAPVDVSEATATGPDGAIEAVVSEGWIKVVGASRVGTYEVRAGDLKRRFSANLLDPTESRIAPRSDLGLRVNEEVLEASIELQQTAELWRWLAWAALALCAFEFLLYNRRKSV